MPYTKYNSDQPDEYIRYMTYESNDYVVSPIAAFNFDPTNVLMEQTNLETEIIASIYPIKLGIVSYKDNIGAALEKLKAAGLDRYMEEYRKQFSEYLANNPWVMEAAKGNQQ